MKNKKIIILVTLITGILITTIGITYSIFTTSKTSKNSSLVVGDIYMHYNETNELKIENAMPSDTYDETKYFEFTIDGKNTYDKPIYYEIDLTNGDEEVGKTRIDSNLLTFRLTEFKDNVETEIFHNRAYSDLTNKRIHVDIISKSDGNVNRTYRLYVKVGDYTRIGNIEDADYTMEEWNNIYASIKVKVIGDFEEKTIETNANCFDYSIIYNDEEYKNTNVTDVTLNDLTNDSEKLRKCVNYIVTDLAGIKEETDTDTYQKFYLGIEPLCKGEYVQDGDLRYNYSSFLSKINQQGYSVNYEYLKNEGIINDYKTITKRLNENLEELDLNSIDKSKASVKFGKYNLDCSADVVLPKKIDGIEINELITEFKKGDFYYSGLKNDKDSIKNIIILNNVTKIGDGMFGSMYLRNIEIPTSVREIGTGTFSYNKLNNIEIPDSVITIGYGAFEDNQLASVTIGNGIQYIDNAAFSKSSSSNQNLSKITINKSCNDIKNIQGSSTDTTKYYPWLSFDSPYTASGVTIYGSNNEVCDSF